jgi:hypothetical protein
MKVVFESAIGREATEQLEAIVKRSLAERRLPPDFRVYISRQRTGWSVFVSGLAEHPLPVAEQIRAALHREAPEGFVRRPAFRRLPRP